MDMKQILADAQRRITIGQGGADVYELKGERIAKHIRREGLPHDQSWAQYMAEARFYASKTVKKPFVPEILHCEWNEDEILIVMRQYRPLERQLMNGGMLEKALDVLAQIHAMPLLEGDVQKRSGPQILGEVEIAQCLSGWRSVLTEHGSAFPADALENIAERINDVNRSAYSARQCFCHGDFHVENLLVDENDNIIVCDWQNIGAGHPAGDIAFLLSRLTADGYGIARERAVKLYCRHARMDIAAEEIEAQMRLANLNTSFVFWHHYLHGAPQDSVRNVFSKMTGDMAQLLAMHK